MTSFFVKNHQFTLVVFLMVVVVSVTTLFTMPRAEDPEINPPQFPIIIVYPGTSAKDMEEMIVKPVEKKISELENLKKITTRIDDGLAVINVEFNFSSDVELKYQELVREVTSLRADLPPDIHSIKVTRISPTDVNVLQLALVSENAPKEKLKKYADWLKEDLEKIKSLKKVALWGITDQEIRIDLRLDKIAQQQIPINAILASIQSEAIDMPGGSVKAGNKIYNIKTSGKYKNLEEVGNTIVYGSGASIVYLRDVADVSFKYEEEKHITRINGHRCILVTAAQKKGENISKTQQSYLPVIEAFKKRLPADIDLVKNFDQANNVGGRLSSLGIDFLIAIALIMITLTPLGWRASLVVMIAIPLSLGLGLVCMNLFGISLNQLSIVGLVVALGLLVDDSIVVVENIERWLREGHSRMSAAIKATRQISLAVVGCTATLIIAFLPLIFLPESSGQFIRGLPIAVITSVFASMIVSLTIVPFLASRVLKTHENTDGNIFLRMLKKLISKSYSRLLEVSLRRPLASVLIATVLFAGSLCVFGIIGFRLFPPSEKPQFLVNIKMPLQSNLDATNKMAALVEKEISKLDNVEYYTSNIGAGNPRIYYNEMPENDKSDYAQIFVQLNHHTSAAQKKILIEDMRQRCREFSGAKIEVKDFEQGPPVEAPVVIRVTGDNLDTLASLAVSVENIMQSIPGAIYVNNEVSVSKSDLRLSVNTDKSRMLGILTSDIDKTVRLAIFGINLGKYTNDAGTDYNITVSSLKVKFATLETFNNIYINNVEGNAIQLSQVSKLQFESSPISIKHLDKKRFVTVSAFTEKGVLAGTINAAFLDRIKNFHLPDGYNFEIAGEAESEKDAFGSGFITVILITVFLFIMVLILEFKTFKSMLIVLSVIPLGIIGGITALWIAGYPMSFVAIIGFIGLAGVEVKNSILLVDFTNKLRSEGRPLDQAIREAGELRFLPIVLTSLTAIGGLVPIAASSNPLVSPLALVLIGGLISSTLLSRIITPVIYKLIPPGIIPATTSKDAHHS
jgi:multidrug efflux pump subunit AcrB